jgi:hypothetical protein
MALDNAREKKASDPPEGSLPNAVASVGQANRGKILGEIWIGINILFLEGAFWYFLQLGYLFEPTGWKEHLAAIWSNWVGSYWSVIPLIFSWTFLGVHAGFNLMRGKSWAGEIVEAQAYILITGFSCFAAWQIVDYTFHKGLVVFTVPDKAAIDVFKGMMVLLLGTIFALVFILPIMLIESKYGKIRYPAKEDLPKEDLHWLLSFEGKHYSEGQVPLIGPRADK